MAKIDVQGYSVTVLSVSKEDFISLTDIAKHRNPDAPADIVKNWMRTRSTIEFLGLWEHLNNPDFKLVEFDQFRNEAGANHLGAFTAEMDRNDGGSWSNIKIRSIRGNLCPQRYRIRICFMDFTAV